MSKKRVNTGENKKRILIRNEICFFSLILPSLIKASFNLIENNFELN
jgi:hypothetical protein